MPIRLAFLRGIMSGVIPGCRWRTSPDLFESLGYASVETYIQSGNVVFDTAVDDENELRESIHAAIEDEFGYNLRA